MATRPTSINREEISALADRLHARSESRLMTGTPELQSDLRVAALVLRAAVRIGFPVGPIAIDDDAVAAALASRAAGGTAK